MFRSRARAFTIVELLVVITIIVTLVAMLLPSINRGRELAIRASCSSMYRQLQIGANSYAQDSKDAWPWISSGSYASLGIAGPSAQASWTQAQAASAIASNPACCFSRDYLNAAWTWKTGTTFMNVPKPMRCPGIPMTPQINSWMPGHPTGIYSMGEATWGGSVVGYGSFLGLVVSMSCSDDRSGTDFIGMNGGYRARIPNFGPNAGVGADLPLRVMDLTNAADDVVFIDDLLYGRGQWNAPHQANGKPTGVNQGYADGHSKWIEYRDLNFGYQPDYAWDRQVFTPMNIGPRNRFNNGGYPTEWGWALSTSMWYGATTPCAAGVWSPI